MALGSELFRDPELEEAWESWKRSSEAKESLAEHRKLEAWLREDLQGKERKESRENELEVW